MVGQPERRERAVGGPVSSRATRHPSTPLSKPHPQLERALEHQSEGGRPPLLLTNLLNDLDTLCTLLAERIAIGDVLNAYLLAAGLRQVVDDHVHRVPLIGDRAASRLQGALPGPAGRLA